ncbi:GtrA family protein [Cystobacter fuscus]
MSFFSRFFRFLRSSFVGILATVADFAVLEICVRLLHVEPSTAKIFSFLVGLAVQFFGNRTFAFHATGGSLRRQACCSAASSRSPSRSTGCSSASWSGRCTCPSSWPTSS